MAYVPNFEHDVFISYAVADNVKPSPDKPGWVDVFQTQLTLELQREVNGRGPVTLWQDSKRLRCGDNFNDEICEAVSNVAVMVVLLSKQYIASDWCRRERETFLKAIDDQRDGKKRMFVIELTNTALLERMPEGFAEIHHESLWQVEGGVPMRLGHPVPDNDRSAHQGFFTRILRIATAIAARLDEFPKVSATKTLDSTESAEAEMSGTSVYLAVPPKSTKEETFTNELKSVLENAIPAVRVVHPAKLPFAIAEAESLVADMKRTRLYVQVVGYGGTPRKGMQMTIAKEQQLPVMLWKGEDVELREVEDDGHKVLVQQARSGTVEDAKRAIIERLAELMRPQVSAASKAGIGQKWFINHLPEDKELAKQVFNRLTQQFECIKRPLDGDSESKLREFFERQLLECNHMVMVYGKASRLSANDQVSLCFKVVKSSRPLSDGVTDWFVVVGPPQGPDTDLDLDVGCPGFRLNAIDGRKDLESSLERALAHFQKAGQL